MNYYKKYLKYKTKYLSLREQLGGDYLFDDNLEDSKKCAEYSLRDNAVFIDDIKVNKQFKDCKMNLTKIIEKFVKIAKDNGKKYLELDDASFMQFPDVYTIDASAEFKWRVPYLKLNPRNPSIYSEYGFVLKDAESKKEILAELERLVEKYKNDVSKYDLVANAKKLQYTAIKRRLGESCEEKSKCFTTDEYQIELEKFRYEYKHFNKWIFDNYKPKLSEAHREEIDSYAILGIEGSYSLLFTLLGLDTYIKKIE